MLSIREHIRRLKRSWNVDSKPVKPIFFEVLEPRLLLSTVTNITSVATTGTPADDQLASANVRQAITIQGNGFDNTSDVIFSIINSNGATSTRTVSPTKVASDGTSMEVVVPDDAMTDNISVVGADNSIFPILQIIPTIADIDLGSNVFADGAAFTILGSGFTEGDLTVRFGATPVPDTSVSSGPNVFNASSSALGAGLDRSENDGI